MVSVAGQDVRRTIGECNFPVWQSLLTLLIVCLSTLNYFYNCYCIEIARWQKSRKRKDLFSVKTRICEIRHFPFSRKLLQDRLKSCGKWWLFFLRKIFNDDVELFGETLIFSPSNRLGPTQLGCPTWCYCLLPKSLCPKVTRYLHNHETMRFKQFWREIRFDFPSRHVQPVFIKRVARLQLSSNEKSKKSNLNPIVVWVICPSRLVSIFRTLASVIFISFVARRRCWKWNWRTVWKFEWRRTSFILGPRTDKARFPTKSDFIINSNWTHFDINAN